MSPSSRRRNKTKSSSTAAAKQPAQPSTNQPRSKGSLTRNAVIGSIAVIVLASLAGGYLATDWYSTLPAGVTATFVGRESCIKCHKTQADDFHGSHHDLAMQVADKETVLASFDGTEIEHYGVTSRVFKDGEKFMVNTEGPDGEMEDFEVKYVFGYEPLQQYMVELNRPADLAANEIGQVQVLRLSWDTAKKKWFYLSPPDVDERLAPSDPLHWTGITQNWNTSCADCHSTNLQKNFDETTRSYHTTFSEIDVSCEACHGPGSIHVELANRMSFFWDREQGYGLAKLKTENNINQIESCAPCHSRRRKIASGYHAGESYHDYFAHGLVEERTYHPDGQILDEVYVYGSFTQSKMFHQNIRCTDCHDPHTARLKFEGNLVCTSCHQHPSGKYDTPAHHQHKPGSPGAQCVNCHMPETTYMDVDPRRDHSLRLPRPDLSVKLGTPNACTACHIDKEKLPIERQSELKQYQDWIRLAREGDEQVATELDRVNQEMLTAFYKWYGQQERPKSIAEALNPAWHGESENALQELIDWTNDRKQPAMYRASAAFQLARFNDRSSLEAALEAIADPNPSVVTSALGRIETYLTELIPVGNPNGGSREGKDALAELVGQLTPLLSHKSRWVRIESARMFSLLPLEYRRQLFERDDRRAFDEAAEELIEQYMANNDRAMAFVGLGTLYENLNRPEEAMDAYRTGMFVEPNMPGPRSHLAGLLDQQVQAMQRQAQQAIAARQRDQYEQIAMQMQELATEAAILRSEEVDLLGVEARSLPNEPLIQYRYGLALHLVGRDQEAKEALENAHNLEPTNEEYMLGLSLMYERLGNWNDALRIVDKLIELSPEDPRFPDLRTRIESGKATGRPLDRDPMDN